jgi:hypothetical protein
MHRWAFLCLLAPGPLFCQDGIERTDLLRLRDRLEAAVTAGDWTEAAELSRILRNRTTEARNRALSESTASEIDRILKWLPGDTETLVVAQEAFVLPKVDEPISTPDATWAARGYVLGILFAASGSKVPDALGGKTLRFAAIAARKFRNHEPMPDGNALPLGMIAFDGCGFYAFAGPIGDIPVTGGQPSVVMGQPVQLTVGAQDDRARYREPQGDEHLSALVEPDLLVVCNNREFFSTVIARRSIPVTERALPAALPEWAHVDRTAAVWGLSHFANTLHLRWLGGADGTGNTLQIQAPPGAVRGRWLTNSGQNPWEAIGDSGDFKGQASTRTISPGVFELTTPNNSLTGSYVVFVLMAYLGFVVLL